MTDRELLELAAKAAGVDVTDLNASYDGIGNYYPEEELRLLIWWATCGHGECDPTKLKDAAEKVSSYMFSITRGMK